MDDIKKENKNFDDNITDIKIEKEMETSFIDYAMSVIISRAIPDARDGLKPIHRRILYAMSELDLVYNKPFKKSAKVVGDVIAKYHPHGDQAAYESMVRMAQTFSLRYPLIDGQGNFGSIDGDSAAAMRYTEARLKKISNYLLPDIDKNTVDFMENYDGSEQEPTVLSNKIPNLLLNGSTGIAVGMATSIPPHNLVEVTDAIIFVSERLKKNEEYSIDDLFAFIKGPDFPTGGIILNPTELKNAYLTGRGRAIIRSKVEIIENDNKGDEIIVKEIPYMVNKSSLIQRIVDAAKKGTITSISNVSDESNREGIRIVIKLKKGYDVHSELNKLYKNTPLQTTFSLNLLALDGNFPKVLNIKQLVDIFIRHQIDILIRKTNFLLDKAEARIHILHGLQIALKNIDEVIEIIKKSETRKDALSKLISNFNLTEVQADAILEMKLSRLTALETEKLKKEVSDLEIEIEGHKRLLSEKTLQYDEVIKDMEELQNQFKDDRRTVINDIDILDMDEIDFIEQKDVVITMTETGYLKRIPVDEYRLQNRGGKGQKTITTKENDNVKIVLVSNTHSNLLLFSNKGKVYRLPTYKIIEASKISKGKPIVNYLDENALSKDETIEVIIKQEFLVDDQLLFFTKKGIVKKTMSSEYENINRGGKIAIKLDEDDELISVISAPNSEVVDYEILIGTNESKMVKFNANSIRPISRVSRGVKGVNVTSPNFVVGGAISTLGSKVFTLSENGFGKMTAIDNFRTTNRGAKGTIAQNSKKAGNLVILKTVIGTEDLLVITNKGTTIRISLSSVSEISRNSKGVKIVDLKENEQISKAIIIDSFDNEIENISEED